MNSMSVAPTDKVYMWVIAHLTTHNIIHIHIIFYSIIYNNHILYFDSLVRLMNICSYILSCCTP